MGIFSSIGESIVRRAQLMQKYKTKYEQMSDSELKEEYIRLRRKSGVADELAALMSVLKDRGYGR